jgi:hypothetical protein
VAEAVSDAAFRLRALAAALAQAPGEAASVRAQALALVRAQTLATPAERVAAAELLVGSDVPAEVEAAQTLALAAFGALPAARPLAATAFDRLRLLAGAPQKFGTQTTEREGVRALWPVDPATTDSERAKWGLPALAELRRRAGC